MDLGDQIIAPVRADQRTCVRPGHRSAGRGATIAQRPRGMIGLLFCGSSAKLCDCSLAFVVGDESHLATVPRTHSPTWSAPVL
jgi:hypothetical protein